MGSFEKYFIVMLSVTGTMVTAFENYELNENMVKFHNGIRKSHHVGPLHLDDNLSRKAMDYAHRWVSSEFAEQPEISGIGINAYSTTLDNNMPNYYDLSAETVFFKWYNQGKNYDYSREPYKLKKDETNQFTQIVWKSTKYLGLANLNFGKIGVFVAFYSPAGNRDFYYTDNVIKP